MNGPYDSPRSAWDTALEEASEVRRVTPAEAVLRVEAGVATLVEVRQPGNRHGRHIEGAFALSPSVADAVEGQSPLDVVPVQQLLILYGANTGEYGALQAANVLIQQGYDPGRLAILSGDPDAWLDVGLSVIRS